MRNIPVYTRVFAHSTSIYQCFLLYPYIVYLGLRLNGRPYEQGDHVEYLLYVRPRGNVDGIGGRLGSSTSHRIGLLLMMYTFTLNDNSTETFVAIRDRPVIAKLRNLYVLASVAKWQLPGQDEEYSDTSTLVHVDAITSKVKIVPHHEPRCAATHMLATAMWEAR